MVAFVTLLAVVLVMHLARPAEASVMYGDFVGTNVTFEDVAEDSGTDALPLYGTPTVQTSISNGTVKDRLLFTPVDASFRADASGDAYTDDRTDGALSFDLVPHGGEDLIRLAIFEGGDWNIQPASNGNVDASGGITVTVLNGGTTIHTATLATVINPDGTWTGSGEIDLSNFNNADVISVGIDNSLLAQILEGSGSAAIAKKSFVVEVTSTPEPGTMVLLTGGALTMLYRRRRPSAEVVA